MPCRSLPQSGFPPRSPLGSARPAAPSAPGVPSGSPSVPVCLPQRGPLPGRGRLLAVGRPLARAARSSQRERSSVEVWSGCAQSHFCADELRGRAGSSSRQVVASMPEEVLGRQCTRCQGERAGGPRPEDEVPVRLGRKPRSRGARSARRPWRDALPPIRTVSAAGSWGPPGGRVGTAGGGWSAVAR